MSNGKDNSTADVLKSQVALSALRDYLYQQKPGRFFASDFVEDIPFMRPHGAQFSNVLPSAAIISRDPAERKKQIAQAAKKVQTAQHKDHPFIKEMLGSSARFAAGSVPFSLALGLGELGLKGKLKGFKTNPAVRAHVGETLQDNVQKGMGQGIAFGALPVAASRFFPFEKKHLDTAKDVLQDHPTVSSLPVGDLTAIMNQGKSKEDNEIPTHLTHSIGGSLLGAGTGAGGQLAQTGGRAITQFAGKGLRHVASKTNGEFGDKLKEISGKMPSYSKEQMLAPLKWKGLRTPLLAGALGGAAIGALGSYLTHPNREHKHE